MAYRQILTPILLLAGIAMAQIQAIPGKGSVDWGARTVTAVGIGAPNPNMPEVTARPMAIRAARDVALRNALELIKGLQMTSSTTVENFMVANDVIRTQVDGYIRKFEASEPRYMSDKTIEITVTIPLDAELANTLLPPTIGKAPAVVIAAPAVPVVRNFTGLVIDARGTGAIPALVPKILDEEGKEVYGSAYVTRDWATKWGMAGYAKTPEQAAGFKDRVGTNPGIIKAVKATGASRCDLVISNTDAMDVRAAAKSMKFLSDCRVIIVVD
ncbi:MAG TPA: hypothetical protein VLM37_10125 [Fibrobacteraceae bacterium]|nr:hypothetical protein [Fibrobacteraceae bacterium]